MRSTDHTDCTAISDLQVWIASKTVADGEPTILGLFDSEEAALEARLATLEAELEAERAALARAERSVRAREASVEEKHKEVAEAQRVLDLHRKVRAARRDPNWRDWASLPEELLVKIAKTHVAQTEAGWAAKLKQWGWPQKTVQADMAYRKLSLIHI